MISARLVHLIETNWEQILDRTVAHIRRGPDNIRTSSLLDNVMRDWSQDLLHNLGHWLSGGHEYELALRFERLGKLCFEQEIPLDETVRGLTTLRQKMMDLAQENLISNSSVELYAEEEFDRRLGRFFDLLLVHMSRGFEQAARRKPEARGAFIH